MSSDRDDLKKKIASELGTADWRLLASHAKSASLIVVDQTLDLLDVALAVAANETDRVSPWIEQGFLTKLDDASQATLAETPSAYFQFVVIAPFVLAQRIVLDS